jgi:hypothetical protein
MNPLRRVRDSSNGGFDKKLGGHLHTAGDAIAIVCANLERNSPSARFGA